VQNTLDRLKTVPVLGALINFADRKPRLAAWIVLSLGIVILLLVEARDVGLLIGQWIALIVASILVAGLCIWIVTWEDSDEVAAETTNTAKIADAPITNNLTTSTAAADEGKNS
jgi:hypothetical protein